MPKKAQDSSSRLRVVHSSGCKAGAEVARGEGTQFVFLYPPHEKSVIIVDVKEFDREKFVDLVSMCKSAWIVDIRAVPRFDDIAMSRQAAFSLFMKYDATYFDLFGLLGISTYHSNEANPVLWSRQIVDIFFEKNRVGPFVLLFDNEKVMKSTIGCFREGIRGTVGNDTRFTIIERRGNVLEEAVTI